MPKVRDIAGLKFGRLTALQFVGTRIRGGRQAFWEFLCECGTKKILRGTTVTAGKTVSCGCANKDKKFPRRVVDTEKAARHHLYLTYRNESKTRGLLWGLEESVFFALTSSPCAICGTPPWQIHQLPKRSSDFSCLYVGLDRIDNNQGYINGNVRPCCKICNQAKHTRSEEEFQAWISRLVNFRSNLG